MTLPRHLEEAAAELKDAAARIECARSQAVTLDTVRNWLEALTDFSRALADVQSFSNESIHEKLHDLAGRVGLREFPPPPAKTGVD